MPLESRNSSSKAERPAPAGQSYRITSEPFGELLLLADGRDLTGVHFGPRERWPTLPAQMPDGAPVLDRAAEQLRAYFDGRLHEFTLPLAFKGTPFQQQVWRALCEIPYGETIGYAELARRVGAPRGFRAVGQANGCNPIAIIVPCHRVIASDGSLGGYGGGLDRKRWLLAHERAAVAGPLAISWPAAG
jgi:methylated-DNA-[protein]-cysteine S-methyltransferase